MQPRIRAAQVKSRRELRCVRESRIFPHRLHRLTTSISTEQGQSILTRDDSVADRRRNTRMRKEIVDGFLRERRRGNTTRKYERFYYWWLAESYIFERNNSIAHESDGILNGGEYVRDGRIADYIP